MRSRKKIFLFFKKQKNLVHYVKVYKMLTFSFARRRLGGVFVRKSKGLSIILMFCDFFLNYVLLLRKTTASKCGEL